MQGVVAVMSQGKIVARMRVLIGLYGLRELGHNRIKGPLLIEPMGKEMHAHTRQMRRNLDDLALPRRGQARSPVARASLAPIELPLPPPPVQVADAQRQRCLLLGGPVEQHAARARWVLVEQLPQQGFFNCTKLSPGTKGWLGVVT